MSEGKIVKIIKEAFEKVKDEIENTEEGSVHFPMFGNFRVRIIEREKEGEVTTVRRVIFRPAKAK